jgi:hypothetical protein
MHSTCVRVRRGSRAREEPQGSNIDAEDRLDRVAHAADRVQDCPVAAQDHDEIGIAAEIAYRVAGVVTNQPRSVGLNQHREREAFELSADGAHKLGGAGLPVCATSPIVCGRI